jgi:prolipoprotein diacylglyceryltransferase
VCYAPGRFLLDYLRTQDVRYLGLTPGQYGSVVLFLFGIIVLATMPGRSTTDIHDFTRSCARKKAYT